MHSSSFGSAPHGHHPVRAPFRFILGETYDAAMQMALDEACMDAVRDGRAPPTLRLYRWSPSAVSLGNFQCYADEIDATAVHAAGISVVRRLTGGGAVYHDHEGEVTYSLIAPESLFSADITHSYKDICSCLIDALAELGVHATFRPVNDIVVDGRKISGSAQTRRGGVVLQHGTILLSVDAATMFRFLTPDKSKLSDKPFIKSVHSAVTSLSEHEVLDRERVERELLHAFQQKFPGDVGVWTEEERIAAQALVESRYGNDEWNFMR